MAEVGEEGSKQFALSGKKNHRYGSRRYRRARENSNDLRSKASGSSNGNETDSMEETNKRIERASRFKNDQIQSQKKAYGYLSRGEDNRLQESEHEREQFFKKTVISFVNYLNKHNSKDLRDKFSYLTKDYKISSDFLNSKVDEVDPKCDTTLDSILISLRKLRESLVALPIDGFSKKVFLFSVRIAANIGHYQTYVPGISFLILPRNIGAISALETEEMVSLLVLHVSHMTNENQRAFGLYYHYNLTNLRILRYLESWNNKDYYSWVSLYNSETDSSISSVVKFGIPSMISYMIKCISRSFFSYDLNELQRILPNATKVSELINQYDLKWKVENNVVIIRDRKLL